MLTLTSARAQSYAENFDDGLAQGWVALTGTWVVTANNYVSFSNDAHDMAVYTGATWNTGYTYELSMYNHYTAVANDVGAVFNYVDSTHYHELLLTPVGTAYLRTANGGSPSTVATATGLSLTNNTWYDTSIIRNGTTVVVKIGSNTIFNNVGLADLGAGKIGVSGTWDVVNFDNISVAPNLPSPWATEDIGSVGTTGSASYSSGTFTVSGAGTGIFYTADEFRFVYQQLSGDCSIVTRVTSVQNTGVASGWEHGGIMLRESLNANSTYAGLYETSTRGILFEARTSTGGSAIGVASDSSHGCPYWLKLTRSGNTFTAYTSSDGSTWTTLGSQSVTMASTIYVGLAVSDQASATTLCTAVFDNVTAGTGDFTPPTVSMTAPSGGSYLRGNSVTVSASASDNVGVTSVQFQLDGANLGSADTTSPYSITWNTTTTTNGSHSLTAIASDAAGNHTTSSAVSVTVDNTAPTVSITAPTNNATVSGSSVTVSAGASDNIGVASVQFKLDGSNLGSADTTSPYGITWDSTTVTDGSHTLTAVASDAAGNATTSSAITVTVSNGTASYAEDFNSGTAAGWMALTGTWVVTANNYVSFSMDAHDMSVYTGATWNTGYTYGLSMYNHYTAVANDVGALFNYVDSTHYHELLLTPVGTAYLRTANGGSPTTVATATGLSLTYNTWYDVSITRSGTAATVTLGGSTIFNNVGLADLGAGDIGVSGTWDTVNFDDITVTTGTGGGGTYTAPNSYSQNFDGGSATNWSATAGTWSVGTVQNGTVYKNTSSGGTSVYTTNTWNSDYVLRAAVQSNSSGSSAKVGLLYNYIDSSHYYKVLLAGDGSAQLIENNGGSETTVASAAAGTYHGYYTGSGNNPWVDVEVERSGTGTDVWANGWRLFDDVAQTDLGAGGIGLTDSGTTANFDNVSVTPTPVVVYSEDLSDGVANNFTVASGTWSVTSGYYRSTGGGSHDYAVYNNATWNTDYTYSASVASSLTGSSNKLGAIYNYVDANNYYEVLLGGSGTAEIKKVVGGTTTAQGAASYVGAGGGTNTSTNQWIELCIIRSGTTTTVNVNGRRVFTNITQGDLGAGEVGVSAAGNNAAKFDDLTVTNGLDVYKSTFPKIGGLFVGAKVYDSTTWQQALAKHDLVLVGIYNGWNGGGTAAHNAMQATKSYNPALIIGNYTIVMESEAPQTSGDADYDVYTKLSSETGPSNGGSWTPNDWWARNTSGSNVSEYPGANETNVTYFVQPDTNGWRYPQWFAQRNKTALFDSVPEYNIWFNDNTLYQPRPSGSPVDWDRNGSNDSSSDATVRTYYRAGIAHYILRCGQLRQGVLTMGNVDGNDGTTDGYLHEPEYQNLLNGALEEAAMGLSWSGETWAGWSAQMGSYQSLNDNTRAPHLVMMGVYGTTDGKANYTSIQANYGGGASYAFMRYALASCMMENGYFSYSINSSYSINNYVWFDEFNLYLGEPEEGSQRAAWSNGVYKRKFQNGLVMVNPRGNGDQSVNVTSLGSYKRFSGSQDSTTNNGANVTGAFTLKQGDGLILLKQ